MPVPLVPARTSWPAASHLLFEASAASNRKWLQELIAGHLRRLRDLVQWRCRRWVPWLNPCMASKELTGSGTGKKMASFPSTPTQSALSWMRLHRKRPAGQPDNHEVHAIARWAQASTTHLQLAWGGDRMQLERHDELFVVDIWSMGLQIWNCRPRRRQKRTRKHARNLVTSSQASGQSWPAWPQQHSAR